MSGILTLQPDGYNTKVSENISLGEMVCKCGCNTYMYNQKLIESVQSVVDVANDSIEGYDVKVLITSWYRCPKHNAEIAGAYNSYHTKGMAVDWKLFYEKNNKFVYLKISDCFRIALNSGNFNGIGAYRRGFVHADVRPDSKYNIWLEDQKYRIYLTECDK